MLFTRFNPETGAVVAVTDRDPTQTLALGADVVLEGDWPAERYYLVDGEVTERPLAIADASPVAIAADGAETAGLVAPAGTGVILIRPDGIRQPCGVSVDGAIEFKTSKPGTFGLELTPPWPHRQQTIEVVASAAQR